MNSYSDYNFNKSRRDDRCITVSVALPRAIAKGSAQLTDYEYRYSPAWDNVAPAGLGSGIDVSTVCVAYGYAHLTPAALTNNNLNIKK